MRLTMVLGAVLFVALPIGFWHDKHGVTVSAILIGLFSASWALSGLRRWLDVVVSVGHIALGATSVGLGVAMSLPALLWLGVFMLVTGVREIVRSRKAGTSPRERRSKTDTLSHTFLDN
ncbi:hypothetical protein [Labedaea rhizosphaerae]|nr:hypothetical protein [Labedaea rhizosphaerae]